MNDPGSGGSRRGEAGKDLVLAGAVVLATVGTAFALGERIGAAAVAVVLVCAVVVVALRTGAPISSCGCFGKVDTPPSVVHVVLDLAFAGVATTAAFTGEVALPGVLDHQPLLGIPFLMLLVIGCSLVFLAFSSLPKTMAAVREVAA